MSDRRTREDLPAIVARFGGLHVWVAGDLMLDEYVSGRVERISPEAPIPVVHVRDTQYRLGGATNVARQIAALDSKVSLCGIVGKDDTGDFMLARCAEKHIDTSAVARLEGHQTTRKLRVLGHGQQLLRLDWEELFACPTDLSKELLRSLQDGPPPDVIILSDYAKGFLTGEMIALFLTEAARYGVPVLVDPKRRDLEAYRGATVITPNLRELEEATGLKLDGADVDAVADAARSIMAGGCCGSIVVTMGERGMLVVPADGRHITISGQRRAVFDVTGAGDTAIAVFALSLAAGANLVNAAQIANTAAGISVGEVGAVAVSHDEITAALKSRHAGKILDREQLAEQIEAWRLQNRTVVFTNGCFDLLHIGHLSLLREAAQLGDALVLAINSDASVRRLKGENRPLVPESERAALLAALDCVDAVTIFDEDTPLETLEAIRPHILVKGKDYLPHEVVGRELVESYGGRLELVPLLPEHSTTDLVEKIRKSRPI